MRLSITRRQRSLLFFLSASGYIACFSGVGERIEAQDVTGPRVRSITVTTAPMPPPVAGQILRDPFDGRPNDDGTLSQSSDATVASPVGVGVAAAPLPSDRGDSGGTVPNIAGAPVDVAMSGAAPGVSMTLVVRATIVGKHSVAYVANGTEMDIVRVGDTLGDRRIASIDLDGIGFTDGSRLDLVGSYNATPAPQPSHANSITLRIDQLRKLFAKSQPPGATPRTVVPTTTDTPQTPAPVTPAPLRTVDAAGIAPGTNPTPDQNAPTAYPYPYPYPPAHR